MGFWENKRVTVTGGAGFLGFFGFNATTSFEEGLRRTIEWYWAQRAISALVVASGARGDTNG